MLTSDEEMLLISSDEPLPQAARIGRTRRRVGDRRSRLVLGCRKYTSGSTPPTHWLRPVASAAPATPHLNTAMNRASSTMLVTPAATVTFRPSLGFSAAMKKLWNTFCSIKANVKPVTMRPYSTQSAIMASVAPRKRATGPMNAMPMPDSTTPSANVNSTIMENVRLAFSGSPSPRILDTSAVPPVPIMKPMPPRIMTNGITRFTEAKAVLPTKLDTNSPSTTP